MFKDPTFSLQLLGVLNEIYYKGADIGECFSTAYRIREGDFEKLAPGMVKDSKKNS